MAGECILVLQEQRHRETDFEEASSHHAQEPEGRSPAGPDRSDQDVGVENDPRLLHAGIVYGIASLVKATRVVQPPNGSAGERRAERGRSTGLVRRRQLRTRISNAFSPKWSYSLAMNLR